ncbi:hypothetical protein SLEP1_g55269 [Rubroshorea leprosula]|uniref:Uncharacterized protein n=1 Tax=Rubroshorea leprosula TaxID=152421 RepID=A0AAV5MEV8_9ROSI|nr:hypothetical protein SLEP1_g55269 [Rubroshorea leprosula]
MVMEKTWSVTRPPDSALFLLLSRPLQLPKAPQVAGHNFLEETENPGSALFFHPCP